MDCLVANLIMRESRLMVDGASQSEKAREICFQEANQ